MNEKKVLELRISYLRYKISKLPRGWLGTYKNIPVVVLSFIPDNPAIKGRNQKRYRLSSKNGIYYKEKLHERAIAETKLQELMTEWRMSYIGEPETIEFPLKRNRFCGILTKQFMEANPNQNSYENKNPQFYKGQTFRSKNELLSIQTIESMGFMWKTEIKIQVGKFVFYPDVVFYVDYIDKPIALELDGMMDKDDYYEHAEDRRAKYIKAGMVENKDVIFFRLNNEYDFNVEDLRTLILAAIERNVADILSNTNFYV